MTLTYQQLAELMAKALRRVQPYLDLLPMSVAAEVNVALVLFDDKQKDEKR